jgi:hypothetical protein
MKNLIRSGLMVLACAGAINATSQTPVYSSYPSASAVIFLDFDGQTVSGTTWNYNGPIFCESSNLNATQITEVFNRVAEDYRPFNINVTTDSTKYLAAPANRRTRVILTITSDWYGSAGGVSFVNSFSWGDDTPCFVFTALLGYNVKNIGEAASHEAGHTLGLRHQSVYDGSCNKISEYNTGTGTGEIGWAPIMGAGYYQNFTLWHNGQSSISCSTYQNDLDVITSATNGFSFRTDDHSSAFNSATNEAFYNSAFTANGVIEKNTDQDLFKFTMPSFGRFKLDAIPYNVGTGDAGSDLDMQVTLYNNAQAALGTYNPGTLLSSVIDSNLSAGTYYLKVEGKGNVYAPNYASLGSYSLQGQLIQTPLPVHKLELKGTYNQDRRILNWEIVADETITEQILEVSTDGRNFAQLVQPVNTDRAYSYRPNNTATALYRLSVRFDNNSQYYSNIVTIKQATDNLKPKLVNTLVTTNMVTVTSPGIFDYLLFDLNGRVLNKGKLANGMNTINMGMMASGIYLIRFTDGDQQWTEKFVKQ